MEEILPWKELLSVIKRRYPSRGNGLPAIVLEWMLRIYFMRQGYGLSNPAMEDSLYDMRSMRLFAKLGLNGIPDESAICGFRHRLERYNLTEKLFRKTEK